MALRSSRLTVFRTRAKPISSISCKRVEPRRAGHDRRVLQARYQYSTAHLNTTPVNRPWFGVSPQSTIELLGRGDGCCAARKRRGANPAAGERIWQPAAFHALKSRHQIVAGFGFETSSPTNRFTAPSDMNLITAAGAPAFAVEFNTPSDSRSIIRTSKLTFADHIALGKLSRSISARWPTFRAVPCPRNRAPPEVSFLRAHSRAARSDRLEQHFAARRICLACAARRRAGAARDVFPCLRASGRAISRLRQSQ